MTVARRRLSLIFMKTTAALNWKKTAGGAAKVTAGVGGGVYAHAVVGERTYEVWARRWRCGDKGERAYMTVFSAGYREAGKWTELALDGAGEKSNSRKTLAAVESFAAKVSS